MTNEPAVVTPRKKASERGPDPEILKLMGLLTMITGAVIGYVLGHRYSSTDQVFAAEQFNWMLAAVSFAPFFIGGCIFTATGSVVAQLRKL